MGVRPIAKAKAVFETVASSGERLSTRIAPGTVEGSIVRLVGMNGKPDVGQTVLEAVVDRLLETNEVRE